MTRFTAKSGVGRFFCPGCQCSHRVPVSKEGGMLWWKWNGDEQSPTLQPSLNFNYDDPETRCHSLVSDGRITFLADSAHALSNQTVELPEVFVGK